MTNAKIPTLPATTNADGAVLPGVQSGVNRRVTLAILLAGLSAAAFSGIYSGLDGVAAVSAPEAHVYRPEDYGAVGDGATNDAVAFQNAIDARLADHTTDAMDSRQLRTFRAAGTYNLGNTTITVMPPAGGYYSGGTIDMTGGRLLCSSARVGLHVQSHNGAPKRAWRGLHIIGYNGFNAALRLTSNDPSESLYNVIVDKIRLDCVNGKLASNGLDGILLDGAYECRIQQFDIQWGSKTHCGIMEQNSAAGSVATSNVITKGTVRGGKNGIRAVGYTTDIYISENTVLETRQERIYLERLHAVVIGNHLENACIDSGDSALHLFGGGTFTGNTGVASTAAFGSRQKYLYRIYEGGDGVTIIGGTNDSDVPNAKTAFFDGDGGTTRKISGFGIQSYDYDPAVANRLCIDGALVG